MTRQRFFKHIFVLLTVFFFTFSLHAELIIDKDLGFSVDIPEGYKLAASTDDNMSMIFDHPNIPVTLAIKIYKSSDNSYNVLQTALNKLNAKAEINSFVWSDRECAISTFSMTIDVDYEGWAVCSPVKIDGYYVTLICYANALKAKGCQPFIVSSINNLQIEGITEQGIVTAFAYPQNGTKNVSINIGGNKIQTKINAIDEEASDFLVNLEYSVLVLYAQHPLVMDAWKRYYRIIYNDSVFRLNQAADDIYKVLWTAAEKSNPQKPELAYAQALLSWVQDFKYKTADQKNDTDFTALPEVLTGKGNDCDSRSMLVSLLLNHAGIDSFMIFSPEYSHAMCCVKIDAPGQTFKDPESKEEYLMGETTAHVTWGTIAKEHSDRTKWVEVKF